MRHVKPYIPVISISGETGTKDIFERCYIENVNEWSDQAVDIMNTWLRYNADHADAPLLTRLLAERNTNGK